LLFAIIRDHRVEPAWTDIALPHGKYQGNDGSQLHILTAPPGRSVSSCQQAYSSIATRIGHPPPPAPPPSQPSPISSADFPRGAKRPYSSLGDATTNLPAARELQPRPPGYPGMNGQQPLFPPPAPMAPVAPQRKKRGRPTKAEWERRAAEAHERGEIWPKPRKAKARPSTEGGESSKSASTAAPAAAAGNAPSETSGPGATALTPSPDASRSVSGGPVQPPSSSRAPDGPDSTSGAASGPSRAMEGIQQHPQTVSQTGQQSAQQQGEAPHGAGGPTLPSPPGAQASQEGSHDTPGRQRS
jgi:hypothetical protein